MTQTLQLGKHAERYGELLDDLKGANTEILKFKELESEICGLQLQIVDMGVKCEELRKEYDIEIGELLAETTRLSATNEQLLQERGTE